jgi:DNA modification methylase
LTGANKSTVVKTAAQAEFEEHGGEVNSAEAEELATSVDQRNQLNDLSAKEWIPETVSVWSQRGLGAGHPDAQIERQHPAPFSFTDVGRLIRFFTKRGHTVLDPFVGVGSTLKACAIDGRNGIGIELNPTFVDLSRKRLATEVRDMFSAVSEQKILEGDARSLLSTIATESVDFVVTSPPYWSILKKIDHKVRQERIEKGLARHYGEDPRDLGKIEDYEEFLAELGRILGDCARTLKSGRYMAVIVSDFRDKSRYVMFHSDLAHVLKGYGLEMRGLTVLYQRHKKIFPYGYPYSFVPNVHNQYILILQKPKAEMKTAPVTRSRKKI